MDHFGNGHVRTRAHDTSRRHVDVLIPEVAKGFRLTEGYCRQHERESDLSVEGAHYCPMRCERKGCVGQRVGPGIGGVRRTDHRTLRSRGGQRHGIVGRVDECDLHRHGIRGARFPRRICRRRCALDRLRIDDVGGNLHDPISAERGGVVAPEPRDKHRDSRGEKHTCE